MLTRWNNERVALLELNPLTISGPVTKKDVALFPWQHPVLIKLQVLWRWGD